MARQVKSDVRGNILSLVAVGVAILGITWAAASLTDSVQDAIRFAFAGLIFLFVVVMSAIDDGWGKTAIAVAVNVAAQAIMAALLLGVAWAFSVSATLGQCVLGLGLLFMIWLVFFAE